MDANQKIEEYPGDRGQVAPRSPGIRSRITDASKTLPDVDGNGVWAPARSVNVAAPAIAMAIEALTAGMMCDSDLPVPHCAAI